MSKKKVFAISIHEIAILILGAIFGYLVMYAIDIRPEQEISSFTTLALIIGPVSFIAFVVLFSILIVYPKVANKKSPAVTFLGKHSFFWYQWALHFPFILTSVNSALERSVNESSLSSFINIQWSIFGITIALYAILHTTFSKNKASPILESDYDDLISAFIFFFLEGFLLLLATVTFYVNGEANVTTAIFANASFACAFIAILKILAMVIVSSTMKKIDSIKKSGGAGKRENTIERKPNDQSVTDSTSNAQQDANETK